MGRQEIRAWLQLAPTDEPGHSHDERKHTATQLAVALAGGEAAGDDEHAMRRYTRERGVFANPPLGARHHRRGAVPPSAAQGYSARRRAGRVRSVTVRLSQGAAVAGQPR